MVAVVMVVEVVAMVEAEGEEDTEDVAEEGEEGTDRDGEASALASDYYFIDGSEAFGDQFKMYAV